MYQSNKNSRSDLSKITKGAGITLSGNMAGKALLFFYTIFLARVIGANDLGLYFLGFTIVRFFAILSTLGLDVGVIRYVAIYQRRNDVRRLKGTVLFAAAISIIPSLVLMGLLFFLGNFIATYIFHKPELGVVVKLFALSIPFESLMRIFLAATRGLKFMQYGAYTEQITWVGLRFVLAIFFLYGLGLGLNGVVLAYVVSSIVAAGLAFYYANKLIPLLDKKTRPLCEIKKLLNFSIPMVFTILLHDLMSHVDILMLGLFVTASEVGIYTVAVRIIMLAQVFFMAFQPIFQPFVAELHDKKEFERLSNLLKMITQWSITISLPIFLVLLFFPAFFLDFFGKEFVAGSGCLSVLVVSFILSTTSNLPSTIIFMSGRSGLSLINNLLTLITNTILNYFLIQRFGVIGAAFSTGISFVLLAVIRLVEVYILMKIHPFSLSLWKPITAGTVSLILILFLCKTYLLQTDSTMFFLLPMFFILYCFLIYLQKLDKEQIYIVEIIKSKILSFVR